ncbi:MAG: hypothetical protein V4635_03725 [Bacteroidota bacterium]
MKNPYHISLREQKMIVKKLFAIIFTSIILINLLNCSNDKQAEAAGDNTETDTGPFVVPDSINTALLIAMFDENDPPGHSILLYADTNRKTAKKIKYNGDKTVLVESLSLSNYRELRSNTTNSVYLIKDKSVTWIQGGPQTVSGGVTVNNIATVTEHRRTDTHLREYDIVIKQ